jgi:hypothetical protein
MNVEGLTRENVASQCVSPTAPPLGGFSPDKTH